MKYDKAREKELKNKIIEASIKEEIKMINRNFVSKANRSLSKNLTSKRR